MHSFINGNPKYTLEFHDISTLTFCKQKYLILSYFKMEYL